MGRTTRQLRLGRPVAVLVWALAAALAGAVVWWAVALIGGEGTTAREGVLSSSAVEAELARETAAQAASAASAAPTPAGTAPSDPVQADPAPTATAPTDPAQADPAPGATAPTATAPATPPPLSPETVRTWDVLGGQIGAACAGAQISLEFATPLDGWTVDVDHAGPEKLEVEFRRGEQETKVRAACSAGVVQITPAESDED